MKRKVIQIADSTQLISLPRKWCIDHGIKKGNELEVEEQGNRIVVLTENDTEIGSVEIDITGLDRTSILFLIRGLYKKGYDEIKLLFRNPATTHYRVKQQTKVISAIHSEVNRLIGMDIILQKEGSCVLKAISKPTDKELDIMLRRIFILLIDAAKDFVTGAKNNDQLLLETVATEKHDTITKFISYSIRIMNKIRNEDTNTHFRYHIISTLDKITDILKICSRDLLGYDRKLRDESVKILNAVFDTFELYHALFYKFGMETARKLSENKEVINNKINAMAMKLPPKEVLVLCNMHQSLELFKDITECRMAMAF